MFRIKARRALFGAILFLIVAGLFYAMQPAGVSLAAVAAANDQPLSDMGGQGTANIHVAEDPAIAFNSAANEYLVVWTGTETDANGEQTRIYGQRVNAATGVEIGANDFEIGSTPGAPHPNRDAYDPAVAYNSAGNEYLVIFVGQPITATTESEVFGQRVAADGTLTGATFQVSECGLAGDSSADVGAAMGHALDLAYNATDNQYLVVWRCDDVDDDNIVDGEFEILGRIVTADGTLIGGGDFQISQVGGANGANISYDAESPKVAWNSADNEYLATWGADNSSLGDGNREIFGQRLDNAGAEIGANDFQISTTLNGGTKDSAVSDIAYDPDANQYLVVWEGDAVTDNLINVFGQRIGGNSGSLNGSRINISQNGTVAGPTREPTVVYGSGDKEFLVTWQAEMAAGESEIFGQRLSTTGNETGADDFRISDLGPEGNASYDAGSTNSLAYASGDLNSYYAVWFGQDDRGDLVQNENEVFGQAIEPVLEIQKSISSSIAGVDAFDTVQYTIEVGHKQVVEGSDSYDVSLSDALKLTITDTLPIELRNIQLKSAIINPGGTDVAGSFSIAGNELMTTGDVDLLWDAPGVGGHEALTIVVEGIVRDTVEPADVIPPNMAVLAWHNNSGLSHPEYDHSDLSNAITVSKVFTVTKTAGASQVTIGEIVSYTLETEVIEGTTANLQLVDTLPAGLSYVSGSAQVSNANGMTINGFSESNSSDTRIEINIGTVVNPGDTNNADKTDSDSFFISYQARVLNDVGNQNGIVLTNRVDGSADSVDSDDNNNASVTVAEPELTIAKSADDTEPTFNQIISYTVTISHLGNSTAGAHDILITDTIPSGLSFVSGSASLPPAQVDEDDPAKVVFSVPTLALVDGSTTFSYQTLVDGPSVNDLGDQLINDQIISWTSQPGESPYERTGGGVVDDYRATASETVTVTGPDLRLHKDDGGASAIPGDVLTYTLTYSNTGNAGAAGVLITETVPAYTTFNQASSTSGWSCADGSPAGTECVLNLGSVPANDGDSVSFAISVSNPLPAGIEQTGNVATIGDDGNSGIDPTPNNNNAAISTPIFAAPDLQIDKDDGGRVAMPGDTITYTVTYTNAGNQNATGVVITETVPANSSYDAANSAGDWLCSPDNGAGSACTLTVGTLSGGGSGGENVFAISVNDPLLAGTSQINNSATITDDGANGPDQNPADNNSQDSTPLDAGPDLVIVKSDGEVTAVPGDTITYTLSYSNTGSQHASGVTISETVPAGTTFNSVASSAGWDCMPDGNEGSVCALTLGSANAGAAASEAFFAVTVDAPLAAGINQINNTAIIGDDSASNADLNPNDNRDDETTPVDAAPDLQISKDDGGITGLPGDTITYTLTFTNSGDQGATGVAISETVPANTVFNPAASTTGWNCLPDQSAGSICALNIGSLSGGTGGSALFAVTVDALLPDGTTQISNSASITDDGDNGPDTNPADNSSSDDTPIDAPPNITSLTVDPGIINENESVELSLAFDDPGNQESHTVDIDWGDGFTDTVNLITGTLTLTETHLYLDDDPGGTPSDVYPIDVTLSERDGDSDSANTSVTVNNVAPLVDAGPDLTSPVKAEISFTGAFTDPGTLDTFDLLWDFGDGTVMTNTLTPRHSYSITGTYTVTLTVTDDDSGLGSDQITITVEVPKIFLPVILNNPEPSLPDLVVDELNVTGTDIQVVIRNQGKAPVNDDFWVDVYIDPDPPPDAVNQTWPMLAEEGMVWGVTGVILIPGQALTLTVDSAYYDAAKSSFSGSIPLGTIVYAQVDSASTETSYGGVLESHEASGGIYNNISDPVEASTPIVTGAPGLASTAVTEADRPRGSPKLPKRPNMETDE